MKTDSALVARHLASNYAVLQNMIKLADTKANIVIVLIGAILSLFFNILVTNSTFPIWQMGFILTLFFISGGFAISTLYPRGSKKSGNHSLIYYKDAMDIDIEKATRKIIDENSEESIVKDYLTNIKALSGILNKKFNKLRMAYIFFSLAVVIKIILEVYNGFLI